MWGALGLAGVAASVLFAGSAACAEGRVIGKYNAKSSNTSAPSATSTSSTPAASPSAPSPPPPSPAVFEAGRKLDNLPLYTAEEVAKHKTPETGIWVTFKEGVYDITQFVIQHPGGDKILLAAGGSIEPFWELYGVHKQEAVHRMLEEYRIGNTPYTPPAPRQLDSKDDPFANQPVRHPALKVHIEKPFIGETPMKVLSQSLLTPTDLFFVRHHLPVPDVKAEEYTLEVSGPGVNGTVTYSLDDLKTKFESVTIISTLQCAGNRRKAMNDAKPLKGLPWGAGAIGTASYKGVRLRDVLLHAGVQIGTNGLPENGVKHVHFEGYDINPAGKNYAASIPAENALSFQGEVILAYEMNGETLTRDHGYPIRVVVPGAIGARSVKWLHRVRASETESDSFWQAKDYKMFAPYVGFDEVNYDIEPAMHDSPVQSAICSPEDGETVKVVDGCISLQGYAYSGGGRGIVRVDVSIDGGKTFSPATLHKVDQAYTRAWAWALWTASVPVPEAVLAGAPLQLVCRAVDHSYNVQPELPESVWNVRGFLNNTWHRIQVNIQNSDR